MPIPFNAPFIVGKELFYIARAVINGHLSGDGPFTKKCHAWLEDHCDCHKALLTHSCTAALEMAALLCDIKPGDEVILPSFTFVTSASAFVLRGATPVFIDIRPDTLNMDERLIEAAITPRTRVIVPVHYAGVPCAMDRILEVARAHKLLVVEDAAQTLFSTWKGKPLGSLGDIGCLSFHETKNIIAGEAGALLLNRPDMAERAEILREKGTNRSKFFRGEVDKYTWVDLGSSYLPNELTAAFLWAQLEEGQRIVARRRAIFASYMQGMAPLAAKGFLRLPFIPEGDSANGHIFYAITRDLATRTRLIEFLGKRGIRAVFHYIPLHSSPAGSRFGRAATSMDVTDAIADTLIRFPLFYEMSDAQVAEVCAAVSDFYEGEA